MDITRPLLSTISSTSFSFLSAKEIRDISVKKIENPVLFDAGNNPTAGGLYDPAMGPMRKDDLCTTCQLNSFRCPGHFGHIELPTPVFHPLFMVHMFTLLRGTCLFCHRFRLPEVQLTIFIARLQLLEYGLLRESEEISGEVPFGQPLPKAAKSKTSKKKSKKDEDEEDEDEAEDAEEQMEVAVNKSGREPETIPAFRSRIKNRVRDLIKVAVKSNGGKQDLRGKGRDRASAVYSERKNTIAQFMKAIQSKKCPRCTAQNPTLTKDGHLKISETDLNPKQKAVHQGIGIFRPDAMLEASLLPEFNSKGSGSSSNGRARESSVDSDSGSEAMEDNRMEDNEPMQLDPVASSSSKKLNKKVMTPDVCRANLRLLFHNEPILCSLIFGRHGPFESGIISDGPSSSRTSVNNGATADIFFMDVVFVAPIRFRPASVMGDQTFENPQNELLTKIINSVGKVRDSKYKVAIACSKPEAPEGEELSATVLQAIEKQGKEARLIAFQGLLEDMVQLQVDVNSFMDSTKNPNQPGQGRMNPNGVKQTLEKKEGLFRKHMMGKRVNYAARSVISPDVNIETNEIGVPPVFAKRLTFPEPVTIHNADELRQLVINGPDIYPGAVSVKNEDGTETLLGKKTESERTAIANTLLTEQENTSREARGTFGGLGGKPRTATVNKQVMRHLRDGDILLLNRQPTLHKPSMMAHKAKVLKGEKTIRMHYANCNSYNADFDGDEMNMHFPQSQTARAECYNIANTDNQYLVPTSGNPLRGLIQDHVVAGVWMTCKNTLFEREEYQQLLYGALRPEEDYTGGGTGKVLTVTPAIWKPQPRWTGKQIITTILLNLKPSESAGLTMTSKAKVAGKYWGKDHAMEEKVIFENGELLSGVLDKSQFGASAYGVVHAIYEIYGPEYAGKLLSIFSRLFTKFLQHRAFSCRMDDLLLSSKGDEARAKLLRDGKDNGNVAAMKSVGLEGQDATQSETDRNLRFRLEEVLREDDKLAALDVEMMSAANKLTSEIIDACIPDGLDKIFPHNNMQMMTVSGAKGSPVNVSQISCLLGSQALEGRRVPVMVSGKTLPSFKPFDTSTRAGGFIGGRFLTGIRPQEYYFHCMAGREGLIDTAVKTSRSGYLQRCLIKHLEGVTVHYDHTVRNSDGSVLQFHYGEDALDVTKSKYLDQFDFTAQNFQSFNKRYNPTAFHKLIGTVLNEEAYDAASDHMKKALKKPHKYGPALSEYSPARFFGATSEKFAQEVEDYIKKNGSGLLETGGKKRKKKNRKSKGEEDQEDEVMQEVKKALIKDANEKTNVERFRAMNSALYQRSLVEPGEAVGLLAAQGVGEPSTQMTLNTFHFAGHGAANVTLGIPRLREIVMTASQKIQTPIMKLPLRKGISAQSDAAKLFCKNGSRLMLSQVVDNAVVTEKMLPKTSENGFERRKLFVVRLNFYPYGECLEEYNAKPQQILESLAKYFVPIFQKETNKETKQLAKDRKMQNESLGTGKRVSDTEGLKSNEDGDEEAAPKKKSKKASKKDSSFKASRPAGLDDASDSDGDDEDLDGEGDGDADDQKRKANSGAAASYEEDDADKPSAEEELIAELDEDSDSDEADDDDGEVLKEDKPDFSGPKNQSNAIEKGVKTLNRAVNNSEVMSNATFDEENYEWAEFEVELPSEYNSEKILLIRIVEQACRLSVVHEIPKITRVLAPVAVTKEEKDNPALTAEGINFRGIWADAADLVDLNKINTNDIGALLHTYGVEAARAGIVAEMAGIFKTYGIGVSMRHLYLIADYQTSAGGFRPFSRIGIADAPSPLLKASFEMTMKFLGDSALYGESDELDGPSANIVVGRPVHSGTGAAHIHLPVTRNVVFARG